MAIVHKNTFTKYKKMESLIVNSFVCGMKIYKIVYGMVYGIFKAALPLKDIFCKRYLVKSVEFH